MTKKAGKHHQCPCGSGKKYLACCGKRNIVSITHLIDEETLELQRGLIDFAMQFYEENVMDSFASFNELLDLSNQDETEAAFLIHTVWFVLSVPLDNGKTLLEIYADEKSKTVKRPQLREILKSWRDVEVVAGEITNINNNLVQFYDTLRDEDCEAYLLDEHGGEVGGYLFGFLLPYGSSQTFFLTYFDIPKENSVLLDEYLERKFLFSEEGDPALFLKEHFFTLFTEMPIAMSRVSIEELPWKKAIYEEVARLFSEMVENEVESPAVIEFGIMAWFEFCERNPKNIKNKQIYAAAVHYLVDTTFHHDCYTQKELAVIYDVSAASISNAYNEIYDVLAEWIQDTLDEEMDFDDDVFDFDEDDLEFDQDDIDEGDLSNMIEPESLQQLTKIIRENEFENMDEVDAFLQELLQRQSFKEELGEETESPRETAQYFIYQALESIGNERYQLAEKALKIYPNCADAYNILAEREKLLAKAAKVFAKGMEVGKEDLGLDFFKNNIGHFWGMDESRGFMRAKFNYAVTLSQLGYVDQALAQFEELLTLNPHDNQGVRYLLFPIYIERKEIDKATALLERYDEGSTSHYFNKLLIELLKRGVSTQAAELFRMANEHNPFVFDYIIGKSILPNEPPDYYGIGDEQEAIVYMFEVGHFWADSELKQALLQLK